MPNQRNKDKKLWGGYISSDAFTSLDEETRKRKLTSRAEFLELIAKNLEKIPKLKKAR